MLMLYIAVKVVFVCYVLCNIISLLLFFSTKEALDKFLVRSDITITCCILEHLYNIQHFHFDKHIFNLPTPSYALFSSSYFLNLLLILNENRSDQVRSVSFTGLCSFHLI